MEVKPRPSCSHFSSSSSRPDRQEHQGGKRSSLLNCQESSQMSKQYGRPEVGNFINSTNTLAQHKGTRPESWKKGIYHGCSFPSNTLFVTPLPMRSPLSSRLVFHLHPWETPCLLTGARISSPIPSQVSLTDPGETLDSRSTSESDGGCVDANSVCSVCFLSGSSKR